jgi:hypothetical protein
MVARRESVASAYGRGLVDGEAIGRREERADIIRELQGWRGFAERQPGCEHYENAVGDMIDFIAKGAQLSTSRTALEERKRIAKWADDYADDVESRGQRGDGVFMLRYFAKKVRGDV